MEGILKTLGVQPAPVSDEAGVDTDSTRDTAVTGLELAPVGHPQMDEEHKELVALAADLLEQRSLGSLRRLRDLWEQHSQHEEALFEQSEFGGGSGGALSGMANHCQHHRVILERLDATLASLDQTDCCAPGSLGEQVVQEIVSEMQRHGDVWDDAYVGKLS